MVSQCFVVVLWSNVGVLLALQIHFSRREAKILKMKANPLKLSRLVCVIVNNNNNKQWQAVWSPEVLAEASGNLQLHPSARGH